jgi:Sec-independent protein translocase protein TatA
MLGMLGLPEMVIIGLAVGIFFFGKNKVLDWARSFGQIRKEIEEGKTEINKVVTK